MRSFSNMSTPELIAYLRSWREKRDSESDDDITPRDELSSLKLNEKYADCDWHKSENTTAHHTSDYVRTDNSMVVRRGQTVKFTARLNRAFDKDHDKVKLDLSFGPDPSALDGTRILVQEGNKPGRNWCLTIGEASGNNITCFLQIPANAMIGRYRTAIYLKTGDDEAVDEEPDLIILCNPWCASDETFLDSKEELDEYVLNDSGYIWRGTSKYSSPCSWNFGQFEDKILDTAMHLIMNDSRVRARRGILKTSDPVWLSRIISAGANSSNDNGVLVGNWQGDYTGGVSPVTWNGSVKIIQQYAETKLPVKFGQCWVFSGVTTTLLRALGIPARSVTNFQSAHDSDNTMTIDDFIDENNEELNMSNDSVWNFHVWNEVWMKGTSHWPEKYAGWAAVDATPQEESANMMQCGPAPIKAIKDGEIYVGYDTGFVFSEVNADRVTWVVEQVGSSNVIKSMGNRYTRSVGLNISTKALGNTDKRHVLTDDYKYQEDTREERKSWQMAYKNCSRPDYFNEFLDAQKHSEMSIELSLSPEVPMNGDDLTINLTVKSDGYSEKIININSVLYSALYTGQKKSLIFRHALNNKSLTEEEHVYSFTVPFEEYQGKFADDQMSMKVESVVTLQGNDELLTQTMEFQMTNHHDAVTVSFDKETGVVDQPLRATINFKNPLSIALTDLVITLEGAGLVSPTSSRISGSVPPYGEASINATIKPSRAGQRVLMVDIDAKEQKDLKGEGKIQIFEA